MSLLHNYTQALLLKLYIDAAKPKQVLHNLFDLLCLAFAIYEKYLGNTS